MQKRFVCIGGDEADLKFEAEFTSSEAVEQQVDAVIDVEHTPADRLEKDGDFARRSHDIVE